MVTTTTPGGQRVSICTYTRTGRHLATFTRRLLRYLRLLRCPRHVRLQPPARVTSCRTRLYCGTTDLVTPPYHAFVACTPASLFLVFPVYLQLRERFREDLPVLRLHSDRGGEFSSDLLRDFCRGEGILWSFTLPASPQQNGIAEHRIGLVMEVARTSMIHAATPHFLWPFALQDAAHQLNLWPCVSLLETSPTLCWKGKVGDVLVFQVWGSRAFVRDTSVDKLSSRAIPHVFLGFSPDTHGWHFYHPTSRRVLSSHDVMFDESVPFYRPPPVDPLPPQGPAPSGVSQVDPLPMAEPVKVIVDFGAARGVAFGGAEPPGAEPGGAASGGAEPASGEPGGTEPEGVESVGAELAGAEPGGTEPKGAELGGAEPEGAESGGAKPRGTASAGGPAGASPRLSPRREPLSPHQLREWFTQRTRLRSGAAGAGGSPVGGTGAGGAGAGAGDPRAEGTGTGGSGVAGPGDPRAGGTGAGDPGAGGAGARGNGVGGPGAGGTVQRHPFFVPPQPSSLPTRSFARFFPESPLPAPSPYAEQTDSITERREPESRLASPVRAVCTGRRVPRLRPPPIPGTHIMALRPFSIPLRVPLPPPLASSLPAVPDPESDLARAASPNVPRLLATVVSYPSFESTVASALVAELVDFAAACRLDYATSLVAESESDCPPSVKDECPLGTNVLEDSQEDFECLAAAVPHLVAMLLAPEGDPDAPDIPTPRSYAEAITGPYSSQWQTAMDVEMAFWTSTSTYVDAVPPSGANIVDGMWIFRVKRPPGSPPVFKARYVARGFNQQQGIDFFQTFSPTLKMTHSSGSAARRRSA
ncbi:unnamed protein product [Closterium sp. NIES-54]